MNQSFYNFMAKDPKKYLAFPNLKKKKKKGSTWLNNAS